MCWNNGKSGDDYEEKTYCEHCYWDYDHQLFRSDNNEDNRESIIEFISHDLEEEDFDFLLSKGPS